ncbi:hypothetical protein BDV25DRAFT_156489 [Aspergillus avenaceus]|uniref:Fungal-specific transcription factor domain-containing protein n=1 Tax=Aspergillus avenaceus TaxID=36643 RepID=A0A5N6TSP7_ASPAV|nr:hypothetical protein BDV25DRAFT_156489 [Aspergillus avenaceus]
MSDHKQVLPVLKSTPASSTSISTVYYDQNSDYNCSSTEPALAPQTLQDTAQPPSSAGLTQRDGANTSNLNGQNADKNAVSKPRKARKATNATAGRSSLFWVHNDAKSVSEGTREETLKRIRSHVMSEHNRKKRLENTKRYKSKAWKHLAFQPPQTTASLSASTTPTSSSNIPQRSFTDAPLSDDNTLSRVSDSSLYLAPRTAEPSATFVDNAPCPTIVSPEHSYGINTSSNTQAMALAPTASPLTYSGPGYNDPFGVFPTRLTDRMARHLKHFLGTLTQIAYPLQYRYAAKLQAHWTSLVHQDPAALHASICVAASNTALTLGEFPLRENQRPSALLLDTYHHRGETIRLVNEGLSDPVKASSDSLIAAVSNLLTIEIASGNPDYLKIHLAGLRQMVALRDDFADVAPEIRFQISWTDIRVACMAFAKPIFPFLRYPRPAYLRVAPPTQDLAGTATGLISLIGIPNVFGDGMSGIIYSLAELFWHSEWMKGSPNLQELDRETEKYFNTEVTYVEYALHLDRYLGNGRPKGDASIEGCVRLACLLFHNGTIWEFYPQIGPVFPKPISGLRMALATAIPAGAFHMFPEVLIWVLFIGAWGGQFVPKRTFFVTELAAAISRRGIHSYHELRGLLLQFFYVDRVHGSALRGFWEEIQLIRTP